MRWTIKYVDEEGAARVVGGWWDQRTPYENAIDEFDFIIINKI